MKVRIAVIIIALAMLLGSAWLAFAAPVCTTDATTGKVTCSETIPSTTQDPNPLFEVTGEARNPATGQRLSFDKWVFPACGSLIQKTTATTFTLELSCEPGFTITWTITQKR